MKPPAPVTSTRLAMDCLRMQVWRSMIDGGDRLPGAAGGEAAGKNELPPPASSSVAGGALPSRIRPGPPKGWGRRRCGERKSVVEGKRVSVRVDLGGGRAIKKKKNN